MQNSARILVVGLVLICLHHITTGQQIEVLYEKKLDLGLSDKILVENHLTFDPNNPDHLLISGMFVNAEDPDEYGDFSILSEDNGKSWKYLKVFDVAQGADPWCAITSKGTAICTVLGLEKLYVYRSEDGGKSWQDKALDLGKYHDHQTIAVDFERNVIYLVSIKGNKIYVNKSEDDGLTFPSPTSFHFSNLGSNTMTPVVLSDGTLLVSFTNFNRPAIGGTRNGRRTELTKTLSWLLPSKDQGDSFATPLFISESCEAGFPVLAVDQSDATFKDRLYYVCSSQSDNMILSHYSDTKGKSWSFPVKVKQYHHLPRHKRNPFTGIPQVAVNNQGVVGVIWQDRMEDTKGNCQYLYFTASMDGGKTYLPPVRVSTKPSCMEIDQNHWAGARYKSGGDYTGFVAKPNGNFQAVWADSRGEISQLYMAEITVGK